MLETNGLTKVFGGLAAVSNVNVRVQQGEIIGLIGPNGAGKTTLFNLITGIHKPTSGKIFFEGQDITRKKTHEIAAMGIGRTFQHTVLLEDFSVYENVAMSFYLHPRRKMWEIYFSTGAAKRAACYIKEKTDYLLEFLGLYSVKEEFVRNLPHGHRQMVCLARALAIEPKLLMLDELMAGMTPVEINATLSKLLEVNSMGVTMMIVEHNMKILEICTRVIVMNFGEVIFEGKPGEVVHNDKVVAAYLGGRYAA